MSDLVVVKIEASDLNWKNIGDLMDTGAEFKTISVIELSSTGVLIETSDGSNWHVPSSATLNISYNENTDESEVNEG